MLLQRTEVLAGTAKIQLQTSSLRETKTHRTQITSTAGAAKKILLAPNSHKAKTEWPMVKVDGRCSPTKFEGISWEKMQCGANPALLALSRRQIH